MRLINYYKMKTSIFTFLAFLICSPIYTQDYDFGDISKAELQEKFYALDSSVSAAILYKKEEVDFFFTKAEGFIQEREIHERVKIYNKEGFDWATKKIYLYRGDGGNIEKVSGIKAYTYNLIDGKIEKDKLGREGEFEEDYNEFTRINSFTMPNLNEGSVIEYRYKITSPFIRIDDVVFQYDIPIKKLNVKIATPEYYIYNNRMNLRAKYQPKVNISSKNNTIPFDYKTNIISINENNVPGLKSEAFSGNMSNYRSKMSLELTAILNANKIITKEFTTDWEKVSKTIYDNESFGRQVNEFNFYKDELGSLVADNENELEKIFLVEDFVKSKVKWNGNFGKYAQNGIRSAYKNGEGNVADINLLVISMLKSLGLNAAPVLISTRDNGIPLFPSLNGFNYVICSVQIGEKSVYIDATEQYSSNNVLPQRTLNWQGRLINDDGTSSWVDVRPTSISEQSSMLNVKIDDDLSVSGSLNEKHTSYLALNYRKKYALMSDEDKIKYIESDKGGLEVNNLNVENVEDIQNPIKVSYEYELSDGLDKIGDKIYFSPLLFLTSRENPFKLEERQYPIDFVFPFKDTYLVNIMLPNGYSVESLPKSEALEFNYGAAKFLYLLKENGKYLQLRLELEIKNTLIQPEDYKTFKNFFSKSVEKQLEQIVLTKA